MSSHSAYISSLDQNRQQIQEQLDDLLKKYQGQPVGNGYIDIIVLRDKAREFINELTDLNLAVEAVSWWCHRTPENEKWLGCPHGMGGPMSIYHESAFSEITHEFNEIKEEAFAALKLDHSKEAVKLINQLAINIIEEKENQPNFTDCQTPGIWVRVPEGWIRK